MHTSAVALAHDYLTQRGGAERVALIMAQAFDTAPLYTTLYEPDGTFPEFASMDVRPSRLNRWGVLRQHHRLAMPILARSVSGMCVDAEVLLTSSSGWAHGIRTTGRKIVYCHAPARWLYQGERYLGTATGESLGARAKRLPPAAALGALAPSLRRWDRRAAASADRYLANSTVTRDAIRAVYGIEAEVVPPPPALVPHGPEVPVLGVEPGYYLCVARLLPYKNVDAVIEAVGLIQGARLVVVGSGPERARLQRLADDRPGVRLVGRVDDPALRWLYRNCVGLVAASYEDYGLSPLEAAAFGRPTIALNAGGYLDTVVHGTTGVLFDRPTPESIRGGLEFADQLYWTESTLTDHAAKFSIGRFQDRLRNIVRAEPAVVAA